MLGGLITIFGGILAASSFIVARKPNAQQLIDKLVPYQGWIGFCMFGWGCWELFGVLTHMGLLSAAPMAWTFWLLEGAADLLVGFILGFGLITKYTLNGSAYAREKGQAIRARLVNFQVPLGGLAIVMGALYIVLV